MARAGIEPKPTWQALPKSVRAAVQAALGAPVRRAARVWGGYSPSPTYRLRLADGRRAFLKLAGPRDTEFARLAFARELRVYRELTDLIAPWAPACLGTFEHGEWGGLLLEDLGPATVPPWTPALARAVTHAYAGFLAASTGRSLPDWLPRSAHALRPMAGRWTEIRRATAAVDAPVGAGTATNEGDWSGLPATVRLTRVAALFGASAEPAGRWFEAALPTLERAALALVDAPPPDALLHADTRSDNLRLLDGRLRLFDWPHALVGPPEFDLAAFAQSVTVEGGPPPEQIVAWYGERAPLRAAVLDAVVATLAGYFADAAPREPIPGLPRLRPFQRAQLGVTLAWAARRLGLPAPPPLDPVPAAAGHPAFA